MCGHLVFHFSLFLLFAELKGVVMYEILERKRPFFQISNEQVVEYVGQRNGHLQVPAVTKFPSKLWEIMEICFLSFNKRPTFTEIFTKLKRLETQQGHGPTQSGMLFYSGDLKAAK